MVSHLLLLLLLIPSFDAFVIPTRTNCHFTIFKMSSNNDNNDNNNNNNNNNSNDDTPKLVLDMTTIQQVLQLEKSKYPTSEKDYLAAARQRAAEARESVNDLSTDDDWMDMAAKNRAAGLDDWEHSLAEAGNADSQILIPVMETNVKEGEEPPEPKLLLF